MLKTNQTTALSGDALLAEIDENLIRADLSPAEEAQHIAARKEVYERLHPETRTGGAPGKAGGGKKAKNAKTASFVEETAQKTGKKKRTVARSATRGKRGKTWLAQITGTCLNKGDEIDALIGLQPAPRTVEGRLPPSPGLAGELFWLAATRASRPT